MKLLDPTTRETFECPQAWPNNRRRKKLATIHQQHIKSLGTLAKDYADVHDRITKNTERERREAAQRDPDLALRFTEYSDVTTDAQTRSTLLMCQASLDTRNLPEERRALVESDVDGDFWQEQSLPDCREAVERFQSAYSGGRQDRRVDSRVARDEGSTEETAGAGALEEVEDRVGVEADSEG